MFENVKKLLLPYSHELSAPDDVLRKCIDEVNKSTENQSAKNAAIELIESQFTQIPGGKPYSEKGSAYQIIPPSRIIEKLDTFR